MNNSRETLLKDFLNNSGWKDHIINDLAGDASFRKYYRVSSDDKNAVIMDAPPPAEDVRPFINICHFLNKLGFSAPEIFAEDIKNGFLILEDLGDARYTKILDGTIKLANAPSEKEIYIKAVDVLIKLYQSKIPLNIPEYNNELLMKEVMLLPEWYLPLLYSQEKSAELGEEFKKMWADLLPKTHMHKKILVCRDFHADNLMWLPERSGVKKVGLLDFQDAVLGSPAYDLVSLLEDARRDVNKDLASELLEYYLDKTNIPKEEFLLSYSFLGAQRNCKILGIFSRLTIRDGKNSYLEYLPRVWGYIEHDLMRPELLYLKKWLDKIVPQEKRMEIPSPEKLKGIVNG